MNHVPPMYISKYNRFVDNILGRINKILRKNYDPVNVRLHPKLDNKGKRRRPGTKNSNHREGALRLPVEEEQTTKTVVEQQKTPMNHSLAAAMAAVSEQLTAHAEQEKLLKVQETVNSRTRPNNNKNKKNKSKSKARPRTDAKATLYGLASIHRDGDVSVNIMSSHTTVKTRFVVGPLTLKVEKEFGRGAKKDIRSATATTTEMIGNLNLRVVHGGAATLHSIRVLQPKQVRVDSSDDHDKTREYVWRRSSHIARVVSQKLTNATRSMLQPPPGTITTLL